jgi:hypothetical protein
VDVGDAVDAVVATLGKSFVSEDTDEELAGSLVGGSLVDTEADVATRTFVLGDTTSGVEVDEDNDESEREGKEVDFETTTTREDEELGLTSWPVVPGAGWASVDVDEVERDELDAVLTDEILDFEAPAGRETEKDEAPWTVESEDELLVVTGVVDDSVERVVNKLVADTVPLVKGPSIPWSVYVFLYQLVL